LDQHVALDFVTHSLGGIVLRVAVAEGLLPPGRIRRVVMLGPPNEGSELADFCRGFASSVIYMRRLPGLWDGSSARRGKASPHSSRP
jgi:triacylglycerol esterase/lipase EstA (alpha/beta hydrolase family)